MKYITVVLALVLLLSIISSSSAQGDDCLDVSVARTVANNFYAGYSSAQPTSQSGMASLLQSEYAALTSTLSPYSAAIGIGYSNNDFYSIQSCAPGYYSAPCTYTGGNYYAEVVSYSTYGDYRPRYFAIDSNGNANLNAPSYVGTSPYYATQRPWYNANGWSAPYQFVNLNAQSESYVIQVQSTGAHIEVDRIPTEPCNSCRSRSPATQLGPFVADSAPLASFQNINTASGVVNAALYLSTQLQTFQLGVTLVTLGVGFDNGNVIFVTDCQASNSAPECSYSRYVAEVRNVAVYGNDHLNAFAIGSSGAASATRDEGTSFNTTARPWFVQGNGWTPYYANANSAGSSQLARSFATSFTGGVVDVDSNPNEVCLPPGGYSCPSPPPSNSSSSCPAPPTPCGGSSGSNNNDNVVINFYFADMLSGIGGSSS